MENEIKREGLLFAKPFWKTLSLLILGLGAIWIWISIVPNDHITSSQMTSPQVGFLAPDFTLESSTGDLITLSNLRGQPVLINFWASWCSPCRSEMPAIERVYSESNHLGFVVLAVNTSYQDNQEDAVTFANLRELKFPILWDPVGIVSETYNVRALPTSFFVDRNGIIRDVVIGGPMAEALLRVRLDQIVKE